MGKEALVDNTWMRTSCIPRFCCHFRISSVLGRSHSDSAFWLTVVGTLCPIVSLPPLPWAQLCALLPHLVPFGPSGLGAVKAPCDISSMQLARMYCICWIGCFLFLFFGPFPMRKAGAKSHFEKLFLSVGDTLETTLLIWLITKWKLIVCFDHWSLKSY